MLSRIELARKGARKNRTQANPAQNKPARYHIDRPENIMFRKVAL